MRAVVVCLSILAVAGIADAEVVNRTDAGFVGDQQPSAVPEDGGDSCPPGVFITTMPYTDSGNTCNGTNTISTYGGTCTLPFSYGGEDLIYEITLGSGNNVTFSADLTGSTGDLALFLISACGDGTSCLVNSQDAIGVGAGPELIDAAAYAPATPGTYYLYVDSYYDAGTSGSCGTYTLDVTGTIPVELVTFSAE